MADSVRWGVLGCSGISQKFSKSVALASNATCVAVASRTQAKAAEYVEQMFPGARAYGSYQELIDDADVQAVYISIPTGLRKEWVEKAAQKKKHVLCEKPIAPNARDARVLIDACKEAGVQFMDDTMFMHHERQALMKKALEDPALVGPPLRVVSSFSVLLWNDEDVAANQNIRFKRGLEPLGALGDLGWYCVRFSLWAFGYDDPEAVSCYFHKETPDGVPLDVTATMRFSGGRTASFDCSFCTALRQTGEVVGKNGTLRVDDFVVNHELEVSSFKVFQGSIADKAETFPEKVLQREEVKGCVQHAATVERFSSLVQGGEVDEFWPQVAMQTQVLMGALVASARRDGSWVSPREPSASKPSRGAAKAHGGGGGGGGEAAAAEAGPIVKKKAQFMEVADLDPESKGVNLQVKVESRKDVPGPNSMAEAVVGDAGGVVTLIAKGDHQVELLTAGASLVVRNASVRMFNGHMRLQVDRWGKIETSPEEFGFAPNTQKDMSSMEYELVEVDS